MSTKAQQKGDLWWVPDPFDVWTLATQSSPVLPNGCVNFLVHRDQRLVTHQTEKCLRALMHRNAPDDLIFLHDVNEATILSCIRDRFDDHKIYTSVGLVLMSINPFETIPGLYGKKVIQSYMDPYQSNQAAHLYMVPSRAYLTMCKTGGNQSILISGESGAGKTEATKQCLSFLTYAANREDPSESVASLGGAAAISEVANRVIAASPILEAFGNAMTLRNPNSSRFGKWMVLNFTRDNWIHSSNVVSYLLEKSRVTKRDPRERNYHIFYQLLRGSEVTDLDQWFLTPDVDIYRYLLQEKGVELAERIDDERTFASTTNAFAQMGFTHAEMLSIFKIVSAILHLGNVNLEPTNDDEASVVSNPVVVDSVAQLLGVDAQLLAHSLCSRSIESRAGGHSSIISVQLNVQKATETRDSLARQIYDNLFQDIIFSINMKSKDSRSAVAASEGAGSKASSSNSSSSTNEPDRCIGLLDIFGFEIFDENSFEQLCINYCNEMLQNHFNFVVFTSERNLYSAEKIRCDTIEFRDNGAVMKAIEGMFKSLDEEGRIPKGNSKTWFEKMRRDKGGSSAGSSSKSQTKLVTFPNSRRKNGVFEVHHYAGVVDYNPIGMLEKNIETVNNDLVATMLSSTNALLQRAFAGPGPDTSSGAATGSGSSSSGGSGAGIADGSATPRFDPTSPSPRRSFSAMQLVSGSGDSADGYAGHVSASQASRITQRGGGTGGSGKSSALSSKSISWKFVNQLSDLMAMLRKTESHFIRTIKSNEDCLPHKFEAVLVHNQLLYSGVFEVVKIQQSGLPCRLPHKEFVMHYRCLTPSRIRYSISSPIELVRVLCNHGFDLAHVQMGVSMTFFKSDEQRLLETRRDQLLFESALKIQTLVRRVTYSTVYAQLIKAYREFHRGYEALSHAPCETAYEILKQHADEYAHLVRYPILLHVVRDVEDKRSKLSKRVVLVQDANQKLTDRSEEGILSLQDIVARAMELDMTEHAVVIDCKNRLQRYYRALEFADLADTPGLLTKLSIKQIDDGVDILREYADILPDAQKMIDAALEHKRVVDYEMETLTIPLERAFQNALIRYDGVTGNLTQCRSEDVDYLCPLRDLLSRCRRIAAEEERQRNAKAAAGSTADTSASSSANATTATTAVDTLADGGHERQDVEPKAPRRSRIGSLGLKDFERTFHLAPSADSQDAQLDYNVRKSKSGSAEATEATEELTLTAMVNDALTPTFVCKDTMIIYSVCANFLKVLDDYVPTCDAEGTASFIRTRPYQACYEAHETFRLQTEEFKKWIDIQMSSSKLHEALKTGYVSPTALGTEPVVDYSEVEAIVNKVQSLQNPSMSLQSTLKAGTWIVKLRRAFMEKKFALLEELVMEADQDGVEQFAFYDYPECVEELNNCQWQVIYHGLKTDALFVLSEPVFRAIPLTAETWMELVKDLPDNVTLVEAIQSFADDKACPDLVELVPPLESILQLRSLMYQRDMELSKKLQENYLLDRYRTALDKHGLVVVIAEELRVCGNLIRKVELEEELDQAIANEPAGLYQYNGQNEQPPYNALHNLSEAVVDLTETLADLEDLVQEYPTPPEVQSQINTAVAAHAELANTSDLSPPLRGSSDLLEPSAFSPTTDRGGSADALSVGGSGRVRTLSQVSLSSIPEDDVAEAMQRRRSSSSRRDSASAVTGAQATAGAMGVGVGIADIAPLASVATANSSNENATNTALKLELAAEVNVRGAYHAALEEKISLTRVLRSARMNLMLLETADPSILLSATAALHAPTLTAADPTDLVTGTAQAAEENGGGNLRAALSRASSKRGSSIYAIANEALGPPPSSAGGKDNNRPSVTRSRSNSNQDTLAAAARAAAVMTGSADATVAGSRSPSKTSPTRTSTGAGAGVGAGADKSVSFPSPPPLPKYINWESVLADFESAIEESMKISSVLPEYLVAEYEVIVGEYVRRSLVCGFQYILAFISIRGDVDINIGVREEDLVDQFYRYNHLARIMNPAFQEMPKNVQALSTFASSILRLRKHVLEDSWDHRIHVLIDSINSMPHGGGMDVYGVKDEVLRVQAELRAREALLALKQALENIRIIVPDKHTVDVKNMVDLGPLRSACAGIEGNNGKHSRQLLTLAKSMLTVMEMLLAGDASRIDEKKIDDAAAQYAAYQLDSTSVEAVFKYIRVHTFLKNLCDALEQNRSASSIMGALNKIKDSLNPIPRRFIPWLKASYIYCELVGAFDTEDWLLITEATRKLEECIETLSAVKITTEGDGHNERVFINLLKDKTSIGYGEALRIKETEERRRNDADYENMTDEQVAKAKLRKEDEANQFGIAALRKAGYADNDIINVKFPAKYLWALDFDPVLLRKRGFKAKTLIDAGFSVHALYFAGFGVEKLRRAGVSADVLRAAGVTLDQLKLAGYPEEEILLRGDLPPGFLKKSEYSANKLMRMGLALKDLLAAGFAVVELRAAGFSAVELKNTGCAGISELRTAGYSIEAMKAAYEIFELRDNGYSFAELQESGVSDKCLFEAGFEVELEKQALEELYHHTNGNFWKIRLNWLSQTDEPYSKWHGLETELDDDLNERIVGIELTDNYLVGSIPEKLWLLSRLRKLHLGMNYLTGPVPTLLAGLMRANNTDTDLDIDATHATSASPFAMKKRPISTETANNTDGSSTGRATGTRAASIYNRTVQEQYQQQLQQQQLHSDQVMQQMMTSLLQSRDGPSFIPGGSSAAASSSMHGIGGMGHFAGQQPQGDWEVADRAALMDLFNATGGPRWHGKGNWGSHLPLSTWKGITVNKYGHVVKINLASNNLTGSIPRSIYCLEALRELDLRLNQLSGPIPDTIGNMSNLIRLYLHSNRLAGGIPDSICFLPQLQILDVRNNQLSEELPVSISNMPSLKYLGIRSNKLGMTTAGAAQKLLPYCKVVA